MAHLDGLIDEDKVGPESSSLRCTWFEAEFRRFLDKLEDAQESKERQNPRITTTTCCCVATFCRYSKWPESQEGRKRSEEA